MKSKLWYFDSESLRFRPPCIAWIKSEDCINIDRSEDETVTRPESGENQRVNEQLKKEITIRRIMFSRPVYLNWLLPEITRGDFMMESANRSEVCTNFISLSR